MKYLKHYYKVITKIVLSDYPFKKNTLLIAYTRLIVNSFLHHKFGFNTSHLKNEKCLGLTIKFYSYPQLINLFEDIFIFQIYKFEDNQPLPFIVDCGSNIGMSVMYFKKLYPQSIILAFEPDQESFELLKLNCRNNNLSNISIFNIALSNCDGEMPLYKKTLLSGSLNMSLIEGKNKPFQELVNVHKLSSYIETPLSLIKIDVEGGELNIINDLLENNKIHQVDNMIIEYHPDITQLSVIEFTKLLTPHDFTCAIIRDELRANATEMMLHCRNKSVVVEL